MQSQLARPVGIILLALNYLLIGCFGTLFLPFILWIAPPGIHELVSHVIPSRALSLLVTCIIMTLWAGGYVLYASIGYGMLRLRTWSLKAAVATQWVGLAFALIAAAVAARSDWMLSVSIGAFCLLWVGGILYYLRRPRVRWPFDASTAITKGQPVPTQPPASAMPTWKIVTSVLTVFVVGVALFVVGLLATIERSFRSSAAYAMAMDRAQGSECVIKTLGQPLIAKGFISGNLNTNNDAGDADLDIPIHGPKAGGNLHVEAKKTSGRWTINSLTVEHSNGQIQLAPIPSSCD
jgi:hypothetical protein